MLKLFLTRRAGSMARILSILAAVMLASPLLAVGSGFTATYSVPIPPDSRGFPGSAQFWFNSNIVIPRDGRYRMRVQGSVIVTLHEAYKTACDGAGNYPGAIDPELVRTYGPMGVLRFQTTNMQVLVSEVASNSIPARGGGFPFTEVDSQTMETEVFLRSGEPLYVGIRAIFAGITCGLENVQMYDFAGSHTLTVTEVVEHPAKLLSGFGSDPTDPKTQNKDVTPGTPVSATYALGSQFFMQLTKPAQPPNQPTPISSMYALSNANITPAISEPTLFPTNVVIEYNQSTSENTKLFTATHLGTVTVTITPDDTSISPVTVNITVVNPSSLGSVHNDIDTTLFSLGHRRGVLPQFLKGQIERESNFHPKSWRYEVLSVDLASISAGHNLRTQSPYSQFRLATSDGLAQGTGIIHDDISPRSSLSIRHDGILGPITDADTLVSASAIYVNNDARQHWSQYSPARARALAVNPALLNFTAQTPIASSWGLLQILYSTAIAPMHFQGIDGSQNPSFLFDTAANWSNNGGSLELGSGYLRRIFSKANPGIDLQDPDLAAPPALTNAFRGAFNYYNHSGTTGAYGAAVIKFSDSYTPVPAGQIFQ